MEAEELNKIKQLIDDEIKCCTKHVEPTGVIIEVNKFGDFVCDISHRYCLSRDFFEELIGMNLRFSVSSSLIESKLVLYIFNREKQDTN
jgi:hypothetical protein